MANQGRAQPVEIGEYGLTGNSGLATDEKGRMVLHVAAPYDANGYIFVEVGRGETAWWRRCTPKQARAWGKKPIRCSRCKRPAVRLDHYWPYYSEMNACAKHARKTKR